MIQINPSKKVLRPFSMPINRKACKEEGRTSLERERERERERETKI